MTRRGRLLTLLVVALLVAAATAGCTRRSDERNDRAGSDEGAGRLVLHLVGVDAPPGADPVVVNMTVDHVAFYDADAAVWMPLFTGAHQTDVLFSNGVGEAAFLTELPLITGTYSDVEVIVSAARVTTEAGSTNATIPQVACYAPMRLGATDDGETVTVELWVSGPDALEETADGWRFRPALIGTVADAADGEATLDEADCRSFP